MRARQSKPKPFRDWIPGWYIALTVVSMLIVTLFIAYKLLIQPPELSAAATDNTAPAGTNTPEPSGIPTEEPGEEPEVPLVRKDNFFTFLLFGVDKGGGNTDTIMIGAYDIQKQALSVVSIPRDTMIHSDHSNKKINATFARGGVSGLENSLEDMLGFPVDFYVKVNLAAFEKIVNAVGGVYYDVPPGMQYVDPTQDLYIDLQPGYQLLDGDKALQLVRCRSAYASQDIGRMETQQKFLKALAKQTLKASNLTKVRELASIVIQNVDTDLKLENVLWFAEKLLSLDVDTIHFSTLPIANPSYIYNSISYLVLDADAVLDLVNERLNPYTTELDADDLHIFIPS
jgi:LCP family protein required for cell wall assembly